MTELPALRATTQTNLILGRGQVAGLVGGSCSDKSRISVCARAATELGLSRRPAGPSTLFWTITYLGCVNVVEMLRGLSVALPLGE